MPTERAREHATNVFDQFQIYVDKEINYHSINYFNISNFFSSKMNAKPKGASMQMCVNIFIFINEFQYQFATRAH